jgi:hypothetical protein
MQAIVQTTADTAAVYLSMKTPVPNAFILFITCPSLHPGSSIYSVIRGNKIVQVNVNKTKRRERNPENKYPSYPHVNVQDYQV